jgi:trehalose 6-phosphate phosphatase
VYKALVEKTQSTPGAKVENNKFCLSVHFRCVDEKVGKPYSILGCQPLPTVKQRSRIFHARLVCPRLPSKLLVVNHLPSRSLQRWSALAEQVKAVIKDYPKLKLTQGRKVLEIRPSIMWDKGKALEFLLEALGRCICYDKLPLPVRFSFYPLTISYTRPFVSFIHVRVITIVFLSVLFTCVSHRCHKQIG